MTKIIDMKPEVAPKTTPVLFIDMDHTLIRPKSGKKFPENADDWEFIPGILRRLYEYAHNGYKICIVTNQAGIDAGHHTPHDIYGKVLVITQHLFLYLNDMKNDNSVNNHHVMYKIGLHEGHKYRKPNADWITEFNGLNKEDSVMVGDASGLIRSIDKVEIKIGKVPEWKREKNDKNIIVGPPIYPQIGPGRYEHEIFKEDHSDSDKQFAVNAGIGAYYDVHDFISNNTPNNLI